MTIQLEAQVWNYLSIKAFLWPSLYIPVIQISDLYNVLQCLVENLVTQETSGKIHKQAEKKKKQIDD